MTVLLVLGTFLVFIVLDYILNRRKAIHTVSAEAHSAAAARLGADYIDGFLVPESLSYHNGHSWLVRERQNVVRVGADEFAAALVGKIEKIELPKPGQWIRQGQKVISFIRDGQKTEMVSPTEGEVMAINSDVLENPSLLRQDPYGKGWLVSVHVPDEENTNRNLIPTEVSGRVDARSGGTALRAAAGAGWSGGGGWRTAGGRPDGRTAVRQLERSHRRVLPHGVDPFEGICKDFLHIWHRFLLKRN